MTIHVCRKCVQHHQSGGVSIKKSSTGIWTKITYAAYADMLKKRGGQLGNLFYGDLCPFHTSQAFGHIGVRVLGETNYG